GQGIERAERLVHEQNRRVDGQRARKSDALALPAGQFTRVTVGVSLRVEADQIEQFIDARADAVFGPALQSRYDRDVAPDGHMREQPDFLQHVASVGTAPRARTRRMERRMESILAVSPSLSFTPALLNTDDRGGAMD